MLAKRFLDIFLTLLMAPLWLPLMGVVALVVRFGVGAPVFFIQERPGYQERPFNLVKFRTMRAGDGLPDEQRLGGFGRWLRGTSLDELPELWNIVKGEMSFVGPRPLLKKYLPLYSPTQHRRHAVPPGLTGWAQVNGRNLVDWERRFALDVWYAENRTLWLDIKIFFRTMGCVLSQRGIAGKESQTMPEFTGNSRSQAQP